MQVTYRQFILSGIVAQTMLFQGFFEAAYGGYIRMYYQKIFHAMATTPVTLSEVLWGELLWDASKAAFSTTVVLAIGVIIGDFAPFGALILWPFCFLFCLTFASLGFWTAALSRTIEQISYPQYLFVFPMFLFCGVFYPLQQLPELVQGFAWVLPLTSVLSLVRTLVLGFPLQPLAIPVTAFWLVLAVFCSRRAMTRRLVK
jgi:lipooligosaccharide transport system permease protein